MRPSSSLPRARNNTSHFSRAQREQFTRCRSPVHRDSVLREQGMARHHSELPAVNSALSVQPLDGQLRFIADYNIEPTIIDYLKDKGFEVVPIAQTKAHGAADSEIYKIAGNHGYMLITHDHDFLDLGVEQSPGVLVVPRNKSSQLRKALDHFVQQMPHQADVWRGTVGEYRSEDLVLAVHTAAKRPTVRAKEIIFCYNYDS